MNTPEPVVMYDAPEAAQLVTVPVWRDRHGRPHLDEHMARYCGATHKKCECGAVIALHSYCRDCYNRGVRERWLAKPLVQFDGVAMCDADGDNYWFSAEDFYEFCHNLGIRPSEVMLVDCDTNNYREVEADYWGDDMPEDGELPGDIQDALDALNAVIRAHEKPISYMPGRNRIVMADIETTKETT